MKVVYEIFDSFQLRSLISFVERSPCGVTVTVGLPIRSTDGHQPSHVAYIGRLVSMPPLTDQS